MSQPTSQKTNSEEERPTPTDHQTQGSAEPRPREAGAAAPSEEAAAAPPAPTLKAVADAKETTADPGVRAAEPQPGPKTCPLAAAGQPAEPPVEIAAAAPPSPLIATLQRHPLCQIWPEYDYTEMASDIAERGQDEPILRFDGLILDGWHRYLSDLKAGIVPVFVEFEGTRLQAAERVHAANNIRRHMTPEQRYACFLKLCRQVPEFAAKYEALKAEAASRIAAGQPLATGSQRVNVVAAKAADAGVSPATAKKVERAAKKNPEALDRMAKGETTANKVLGKAKGKGRAAAKPPGASKGGRADKREDGNGGQRRKEREAHPGDLIYEVEPNRASVAGSPRIIAFEVCQVDTHSYVCVGGKRLHKPDALSLHAAKSQRTKIIQDEIADLEADLKRVKAVLQQEPTIVAAKKNSEQG